MPQGPRPPDYVIPSSEIGAVMYIEKQAVGIQFVDPSGAQCFVAIDGRMIPLLAKSLSDLAIKMPSVLGWKVPDVPK